MLQQIALWAAAFAFAIASDVVHARWVICVSRRAVLPACIYSGLCPIVGSLSFLLFLSSHSTLLPSAAGYALGTWLAIRGGKK